MKKILLLCLLLPGTALATNGMRMTGFGPVQSSMGGVGAAVSLDGSAMMANPAGLAFLPSRIDLGGTYFKPSVSYSATEAQMPQGYSGAVVAQPGTQLDSQRGASPIPSLAAVFAVRPELTVGLGVFGASGMGVDYGQNLYGGSTYTSYLQARLTPSIAYRVTDTLAIGVTVNAMAAQIGWNVAAGFGQQPHDTSTSYGLGASAGVQWKALPWLALGAAYESRSYFRDFSFSIGAHQAVNPATFQAQPVGPGTDKLAFDQPMNATVGLALTPFDALVVAADVQWINWSATNGADLPTWSLQEGAPMPWDMGWSDQWVFKVGAQYEVGKDLRLRLGYNYGKMPLDPSCAFENLAFPAVSEHHLSAGIGYDLGRFTLNAGGTFSPKATLSGANAAYPAQGGQAIASYTTSMSQLALDFGVAYRL